MAIEVKDLAIELRISVDGDDLDAAQTAVLTRLKAVGESLVEGYADDAPDSVRDEAVIGFAPTSTISPRRCPPPQPTR